MKNAAGLYNLMRDNLMRDLGGAIGLASIGSTSRSALIGLRSSSGEHPS